MNVFFTSRRALAMIALVPTIFSAVFSAVISSTGLAASEFDKAAPTSDKLVAPVRMTESNRQRILAEILGSDCDKKTGRCWLTGVDSRGSGWTMGCNAGVGARNYGTGTTVINVAGDTTSQSNDPYYSCSVTYRSYECETNIRVSRAAKMLFESAQLAGMNEDGSVKRTFSPAEQTLNSLYATLQAKLDTCKSNMQ